VVGGAGLPLALQAETHLVVEFSPCCHSSFHSRSRIFGSPGFGYFSPEKIRVLHYQDFIYRFTSDPSQIVELCSPRLK